jgi:TetR/AcrR family transcriptional regulator, tetracycline repressor protein
MLLRRPDVLNGALDLLDAEGLDGLTMRRLGASLNVQGGALYRHFPSKEALLDAMAERLLESVADAPLPEGPWPERLRTLGSRLHAALLSRRDGARVVVGTYTPGPNSRALGRVAFGILLEAGFPLREAATLQFAMFHFVLGHTIEEQAAAALGAGDDWAARIEAEPGYRDDPYRQAMLDLARSGQQERFEYGMKVFIDGARAQVGGRSSQA